MEEYRKGHMIFCHTRFLLFLCSRHLQYAKILSESLHIFFALYLLSLISTCLKNISCFSFILYKVIYVHEYVCIHVIMPIYNYDMYRCRFCNFIVIVKGGGVICYTLGWGILYKDSKCIYF